MRIRARPTLSTAPQQFVTGQGDGGGQVLAALGRDVQENIARSVARQENAWIAETTAAAQLEWTERTAAAERDAGVDGEGHVDGVRAAWSTWSAETLAAAPTDRAREAAQQRLASLQTQVFGQAGAFEAQRKTEHRIGALSSALGARTNAVIRGADPGAQIAALQGDIAAARGEGLIDAVQAERLASDARGAIIGADLDRRIEADPRAALSALDAGTYDAELSPKAVMRARRAAQTEIDRRQAAYERRVAARVRDVTGAVSRGYDHADEDGLRAELTAAGMTAELAELDQAVRARDFADGFGRMSPEDQAAVLARAGDTVRSAEEAAFRGRLDRLHAETKKAVATDPVAHYARVHDVALPEADPSDPDAIAARADIAAAAGRAYGVAAPLYTREEADALADQLAGASPDDAVGIVGAHAQALGRPTYRATMAAIAKKEPVVAVAGVLAQTNAAVAREALQGRRVVAEQPDVLPPKSEYLTDVDDLIGDAFAFDPAARSATVQTALAVYGQRRFAAGEVSRGYDADELRRTIEDVTGGVYDVNGAHVIAPRPGVDDDDFETLIESLSDDDLTAAGGAVDASGRALGAAAMADAQYVSVGEGRYLVRVGGGFAQREDGGGATVLDLGALIDGGRLEEQAKPPAAQQRRERRR